MCVPWFIRNGSEEWGPASFCNPALAPLVPAFTIVCVLPACGLRMLVNSNFYQRAVRILRHSLIRSGGLVLVLRSKEKGDVYVTDSPVSVNEVALLPR